MGYLRYECPISDNRHTNWRSDRYGLYRVSDNRRPRRPLRNKRYPTRRERATDAGRHGINKCCNRDLSPVPTLPVVAPDTLRLYGFLPQFIQDGDAANGYPWLLWRSEERRVGKECRSPPRPQHQK